VKKLKAKESLGHDDEIRVGSGEAVGLEDVRYGAAIQCQDWGTAFNLVGDAQFTGMPGSGQQYHHPVRVLLQMIDRVNGHGRVPHQLGLTKADKIHTAVSMGTKGAADKIPVLAGHVSGPPIQFLPLRF
jgi:hypothetical protein